MRIGWVLGFAMSLPAQALAGPAVCEYRHPDHPSWDFFTACDVEAVTEGAVTTYRVAVANGSRFTAEETAGDDGATRYSVNGLAATRLERGESRCYLTDAEAELICIHPEGTDAPAGAAAPAPVPAGAVSAQVGFGGGVTGFCLLVAREDGADRLVDYGACVKRENCLVSEAGGTSCLTDYDWTNGRISEMARAGGWQTLDGAPIRPLEGGCVSDDGGGLTFCFSRKAMTAADHPVLAGGGG